ncbi:MAG TPA: response regulator [Terracidiphilus sp.]|nr:response regulator [Terracidiphilus sp.]
MISSADMRKASILIVDDQEANVSLLEQMLHDAGYVSIASTMDPREVCELHRKNRYDLILLDLQMPGMDGFQVMEDLKKIETEGYLPVLVITALPGHKLRALKAGAKDFVSKPFDLGEVLIRVYNMLEVRLLHLEIKRLYNQVEERVAQRTAELEESNKELEAFSYSVSHDLRAPLRALDGFSQAMLDDFGPQLPAEGQFYLKTIRYSAQQMSALIDALLEFSRFNRQELIKQAMDTRKLVHSALDELGFPWQERQVEIRVGDLPVSSGDPVLLKQVWMNLLSNALKYTNKRKKAEIEIGSTKVDGTEVFFVRDNGTGFDMRYADKLFGVFERLHRMEDYEGTGIGLAMVQRIVNRHGGRVWANSAIDRGATFNFTLEKASKS